MEDTLRATNYEYQKDKKLVLILVLMEDTLRECKVSFVNLVKCGLNPCFNGRYSQRTSKATRVWKISRLNPCFNGRYSQRAEVTRR